MEKIGKIALAYCVTVIVSTATQYAVQRAFGDKPSVAGILVGGIVSGIAVAAVGTALAFAGLWPEKEG